MPINTTNTSSFFRNSFGMLMPNKHFGTENYKLGFNGKRMDNEVSGNGNSYDFGARQYDPRLGRWMSIDPLAAEFVGLSPYCFVGNMPIIAIDPDGEDIFFVNRGVNTTKPEVTKSNFIKIMNYLNSTVSGQKLLQTYLNNPNKDIYFTIGGTEGVNVMGTTNANRTEGTNDIVTPPTVVIGGSTYLYGLDKTISEFEGVRIDPEAEVQFVTFNEDEDDIGTKKLEDTDVYYLKKHAKNAAHEVGAHVDDIGSTSVEDHTNWGQEGTSHSKSVGTGKAKIVNTEINKLKAGDIKKNALKLKDTSQQGVSKLTE